MTTRRKPKRLGHRSLRELEDLKEEKGSEDSQPDPGAREEVEVLPETREATLLALRDRPNEKLAVEQIVAAIELHGGRRIPRRTVEASLDALEREELVKRLPATPASASRPTYIAV